MSEKIDRIGSLKRYSLFSEMDEKELARLIPLLERRTYPDGTAIFYEGDLGERVYFLREGKVKAIKSTPAGNEQILEILQPGDIFGEVVLFEVEEYPATTRAIGEVRVDILTRDNFRNFFLTQPEIGWGMLKVMARKLARSQHKIGNLGLRDARGKVAVLLIDLLKDFGQADDVFAIDLNQQELADYIGVSRETFSRVLSQFRQQGFIEIEGNSVIIKDLGELRKQT